MATLTTRVTHLEGCVGKNTNLLGAVVDKIDTIMERQLADMATLKKHTNILENGLSDTIAKAIAEEQRADRERETARRMKQAEIEREERRLQLEEQREANAEVGRKKDRTNRLLIAAVPVITVAITLVANRIFGG